MCATFAAWRAAGHRDIPWLAGPGLSALAELDVPPPSGEDVQVLQRFLVGADADPRSVNLAVDHDAAETLDTPEVPPDARAALVASVERFFALLVAAYAELRHAVVTDDREGVDTLAVQWQTRLDDAAQQIEERGRVVRGLRQPAATTPTAPRKRRDHAGLAIVFVAMALTIAALMLWAVSHGWPVESVDFGI